LPIKDNP